MTITSDDIKVFQAQDNTDNDNGGGSRTSVEIVDGAINNLFPDISRIDTVSGDVALRKVFPTVYTENRDVYYGAHAMIRKTPTDDKVSSLLFYTDDPHDKRIDAQDKIESYVVASFLEQFYLYSNHVVGARSVTFLQQLDAQVPDVGNTYLLKYGNEEQYIRIEDIDAREITLLYSHGSNVPTPYTRRRIICTIDQPLEYAFIGSDFHPSGQQENTTDTFATQVANAAKYYSTKTMSENAVTGDTIIKVDSIYEQLVPASKKQTPLINVSPLSDGIVSYDSGKTVDITMSISLIKNGDILQVPNPFKPNSLRIANGAFIDDGNGELIIASNSNVIGSVNYETGLITASALITSGNNRIEYESVTSVNSVIPFTNKIKITQENQGLVYVRNLSPMPTNGGLHIDYRSQGKWYRFSSNPNNTLGNDPTIGAGQIFNNGDGTGSVSMTLGSLPDIDSTIVVTWGSGLRVSNRANAINSGIKMVADLGSLNIDPLSFTMSAYAVGHGLYREITANASGILIDEIAGATVGVLDFINGKLMITGSNMPTRFDEPNSGRDVTINFSTAAENDQNSEVSLTRPFYAENQANSTVSFEIGSTVIRETVRVRLVTEYKSKVDDTSYKTVELVFDSNGDLQPNDANITGTVTTAGIISLTLDVNVLAALNNSWNGPFGTTTRYIEKDVKWTVSDQAVVVKYATSTVTPVNPQQIVDKIENIFSYELSTVNNVAGELSAFLFDATETIDHYIVSKNGVIFNNPNDQGVGVNVGTIDYVSGLITMNYFQSPDVFNVNFTSLVSDDIGNSGEMIPNTAFRTASTKLTTSSFQMRYETVNGQYTLTTDGNGNVTGTDIDVLTSYVDTNTGMANIEFTADAKPDSFFYDAVAETSLPLDPELLGLNPVRLPSDGRVPVFDAGRHLIIFHEVTTAVSGGTPVADQVVTLARSGQSYIEVIDTNGKRLDPAQYVADKEAGTVTFGNPLSLVDKYGAALTAPFSVVDRVEDMLLATDVQINGQITLSAGLSRDYPVNDTRVASALVWGDLGARVFNLFSQEIWDAGNPVWSDELIGDPTSAKYNDIQYPIQIDNKSSTAARWAIVFKSSTTVDIIEEKLGVIESGVSISIEDVAPINPTTGQPYFIMDKNGFGAGWITNNVIRFNSDSGDANMWVIRTVQSGALSELTDSIELETRGDAN